jgi:hypothetical protein
MLSIVDLGEALQIYAESDSDLIFASVNTAYMRA